MKILEDGRIQCRVKIEVEYDGEKFTYIDSEGDDGSQFIWPPDDENGWLDEQEVRDKQASKYWWELGNMSCDCNRWSFLPEHLQHKHNGECGHTITLYSITPIEGDNLPTLILIEQ